MLLGILIYIRKMLTKYTGTFALVTQLFKKNSIAVMGLYCIS